MNIVVDKCCFCIELRTGCLIIGYLNLIGNIIAIIMSILALAAAGVVTAEGDKEDGTQAVGALMLAVIGILLIFFFLFLAFSIVLLVGIHKHKRGHVKAYLIYTVIFLVLYIIMFFAGFGAKNLDAGVIVRDIISIALSIYFMLVIRSYYFKMDDPSNKPAVYNTA